MKKNIVRPASLVLGLALLATIPATAQEFNRYVALGDSLTAGVEGNCLVQRNQVASYPAVIGQQLGISGFEQPLVQELALSSPLVGIPCLGAVFIPPSTVTVGAISQMGAPLNLSLPQPYNNLGIPGADAADLVTLTQGNPSGTTAQQGSALVLRNFPGSPFNNTNAVTQANLLQPDLVTLWIGSNDVLGAALSGVAIVGVTITPLEQFTSAYQADVAGVSGAGRALVAANIPAVTSIPFVTTIPPVLVDPATRQPVVIGGQLVPLLGEGDAAYPCNPVPPDQGCGLPPGSRVTLPASQLLAQGIGIPVAAGGTGRPLPNGTFTPPSTLTPGVVLYPDEIELIDSSVDSFNGVIASTVAEAGGSLVDVNEVYSRIATEGYEIGGITLTNSFLTGGVFSADGYHPSSIGYTILADEFIKVMNVGRTVPIPPPDFSHVLFTPNCFPGSFGCPLSQTSGASAVDGGPWNYTLPMWENLMNSTLSSRQLRLQMPQAPRMAPQPPSVSTAPTRSTRSVDRQRDPRD
jgi:lysophospholipase L1-like esterase